MMIAKKIFISEILIRQKHAKWRKMYDEFHTDEEIAFANNVDVKEVRSWRKANNLPEKIYVSVKNRKRAAFMMGLTISRKDYGKEIILNC